MLRSCANRTLWAGVVGLGLTAPAAAQPPADPIAASNRLTDPWVAPKQIALPAEGPVTRVAHPSPEANTPVTWSAPTRRPITPILPTPERPMMACEPTAAEWHLRAAHEVS